MEKHTDMVKTTQHAGAVISYRDLGKGPVLMLVHGFGEAGDIWDLQSDALASEYRVIVPDLAGSGSSPLPPGAHVSLDDHARCLLHILDAESVGECTMVGHSMGGYIALAFAEAYPERLSGLGLFHSTAAPDSDERKALRLRSIALMERSGASTFLREAVNNLYAESFRASNPSEVAAHVQRSVLNFEVRALVSYYRAIMERPDRRGVLSKLGKPVLMVMGEEDKAVVLQEVLPQCALPEVCHVHVWKGVAHMGMKEVPGKALAALTGFMKDINRG